MVKLGALLTLVAPSAATASLAARLHDADFFERSWGQEVAHLRADDASAFDALAPVASPAYVADLLREARRDSRESAGIDLSFQLIPS